MQPKREDNEPNKAKFFTRYFSRPCRMTFDQGETMNSHVVKHRLQRPK